MKYIEWDENVVSNTLRDFSKYSYYGSASSVYGLVALNLLRKHYGMPLVTNRDGNYTSKSNILEMPDGTLVKVANHLNKEEYFTSDWNNWQLRKEESSSFDVYLFTVMDKDKKKLAIMGFIPSELLPVRCPSYNKGDVIEGNSSGFKARFDCIYVTPNNIEEVNQ